MKDTEMQGLAAFLKVLLKQKKPTVKHRHLSEDK